MPLEPLSGTNTLTQQQLAFVSPTGTAELHFLLYLPEGYDASSDRYWPLVLFLHGAGERGQDLREVLKHGIPKHAEGAGYPFIAVSPQCPAGSYWTQQTELIKGMLDEVIAAYTVDADRVYLTGISMGGYGSWHLAADYPDLFAAVAPICGGGMESAGFPDRVLRLKDVPIWAFHGARDEVVPCRRSQVLVDKLREAGAGPRFTVYPDAGHDSWTRTYDDPEFYRWLLAQHRDGSQA
ncbi:MAG: carboxylesterase family protein [Anaerolineae bacterium]